MKLIGVQCDVTLGQPAQNLARMQDWLDQAAKKNADLVIFPECAVTGYGYDSREQALEFAQKLDGEASREMIAACQKHNMRCLYGFLENLDGKVFNSIALVGADGLIAIYRKIHLPFIGVDRYTDYGCEPLRVHEVGGVKIGLNICYDAAFPEVSRILALEGADLIALPTNWPPGAEIMSPTVIQTRALENGVYYAAVNRVGLEAGCQFIGRSCIAAPNGKVLAMGSNDGEEMLEAEIDVEVARNKHTIRIPGISEIDRFADRRPEFYEPLIAPHSRTTPRVLHHGSDSR